jgi:hypothetical protein
MHRVSGVSGNETERYPSGVKGLRWVSRRRCIFRGKILAEIPAKMLLTTRTECPRPPGSAVRIFPAILQRLPGTLATHHNRKTIAT